MISKASDLPVELFHPEMKLKVIAWIRETGVPSRFRRAILHDWAAAVGAELNETDYILTVEPGSASTE